MSVEDDWTDLARGAALREWQTRSWESHRNSWENGNDLENSDAVFSPGFVRNAFIRGYILGFLAAKKRDVVMVDPYKVEEK